MLLLGTSFIRSIRKAVALHVLSIYLIIKAICLHQSGKNMNNRRRNKETSLETCLEMAEYITMAKTVVHFSKFNFRFPGKKISS